MNRLIFSLICITLLVFLPLSGCKSLVKGSGELKTRDFSRADFSEIQAADGFDVKIVYASSFNVTITADDNLFDHIQVTKKGDTLKLGLNRADYIDTTIKAVITMPHLRKLSLTGQSTGSITGFSSRASLELKLSGDSSLSAANMTVGDVILDVADTSKMTGNLTAGDVSLKVTGASTVQLGGTANDLDCEAASSSLLKLETFTLRNAKVKLSGESTATLKLDGKLDVELSKSSRLIYYGDPVLGETQISGGSTMTRK
jgi:hypothetical protein